MKSEKKYYKGLDILRIISCIAVLLYHLNILKGGYLAVCIFFVMTGYLSCLSALKNDEFSIMKYYKNRLLHIYLPFIIIVFISLSIVSFFPKIGWVSLKPETTSVLLGYNNFWQLKANLDYFARHIDSPFMHLWYISILLQFELIFPFIYKLLNKLSKIKKQIPIIVLCLLTIISTVYFYYSSQTQNIMSVYYNTFSRIFSIIFGITLCFIHKYYKHLIFKRNKLNYIVFSLYTLLLVVLFITIKADSKLFPIAMILTTIITCRLIDYSKVLFNGKKKYIDDILSFISKISYEVYLVQYPVIFLFQYIKINSIIKLIMIITLIILISYVLHSIIYLITHKEKINYLNFIPVFIVISLILYGIYIFVSTEDHTKEMNELEKLLDQNEEVMKKRQEEYMSRQKEEQENWSITLSGLEENEEKLNEIVTNLHIIGIGDSVMLGAVNNLYSTFPNGYFDARISRTDYEANAILESLKYSGMLGEPILFHLGTNGQCGESCRQVILNTCENRKMFWVTVTNDYDVNVNSDLIDFASKHDNVRIIDWNSISNGHPEYFITDGIHLTYEGRIAYSKAIYDAIYNAYLDDYKKQKESILENHQSALKEKITFYGNDLLLNAYPDLQENFMDASYVIDKNLDIDKLVDILKKAKDENSLTYKIVLVFDNTIEFTNKQLKNITDICSDNEIYVVNMSDNKISTMDNKITVINFYNEIKKNKNYLMIDKIHLTDDGNKALNNILNNSINTKKDLEN